MKLIGDYCPRCERLKHRCICLSNRIDCICEPEPDGSAAHPFHTVQEAIDSGLPVAYVTPEDPPLKAEFMRPGSKEIGFPSLLESAEQDRHHQQVVAAFLAFCVVQALAFAVLTACCP